MTESLEASLDRLLGADSEAYRFSVERKQLAEMLADLRAGRDVCVPGWRIPGGLRPDRCKVFTLSGDQLVPQDYEKVEH